MIFGVYSVFDSKAGIFSRPMFYDNDAVATRAFDAAVNHPDSEISSHPEDYTLFRVGEWNGSEGKLSGEVPVSVVNGVGLKRTV